MADNTFLPIDNGGQIEVLSPQGENVSVDPNDLGAVIKQGYKLAAGPGKAAPDDVPVEMLNPSMENVAVHPSDLGKALAAGFSPNFKSQQASRDEYAQYGTGVGNAAKAFGEGATRTLIPFGGGAALLDSLGDTKEAQLARARLNPVSSTAGSVAGAIVPAVATSLLAPEALPELGTAEAAEMAPAAGELAQGGSGLFSAAARVATGGAEGTIPSLARAGIQGALYNDSNTVDQAYLTNQPLTVQALAASTGLGFVGGVGLEGGLSLVGKGVSAGLDHMKSSLWEATKGRGIDGLEESGLDLGPLGKKGLVDSHLSMNQDGTPGNPFSELDPTGINSNLSSPATQKLTDVLNKNGLNVQGVGIVTNLNEALDSFGQMMKDPQSFVAGTSQNEIASAMSEHLPQIFADSADGNTSSSIKEALGNAWSDALNGHLENESLKSVSPTTGGKNPFAVTPPEQNGISKLGSWTRQLGKYAGISSLLHGNPLGVMGSIIGDKLADMAEPFINQQKLAMARYLSAAPSLQGVTGEGLSGKLSPLLSQSQPHPVIPFQQASLSHMGNAAMDPKTDKLTAEDLGNQIISAIQKVDNQTSSTADSIVSGKGQAKVKDLPSDISLKRAATPDDIEKVRDYLSEANQRLIQGNPTLNSFGAASIRELQNALPAPPLNIAPALGTTGTPVGVPTNLKSDRWTPNPADIHKFNQVASALNDPLGTLAGVQSGRVSAAQMGAISRVYPDLLAKVQGKVSTSVRALGDEPKLSLSTRNNIRSFLSGGIDPGISQQTFIAITSPGSHAQPPGNGNSSKITPAKEVKLGSRIAPATDKVSEDLEKN